MRDSWSEREEEKKRRRRRQGGEGVDIQKLLSKTGIVFHMPGYQYLGPGTHLKKKTGQKTLVLTD